MAVAVRGVAPSGRVRLPRDQPRQLGRARLAHAASPDYAVVLCLPKMPSAQSGCMVVLVRDAAEMIAPADVQPGELVTWRGSICKQVRRSPA
jgi:hypothetical protein